MKKNKKSNIILKAGSTKIISLLTTTFVILAIFQINVLGEDENTNNRITQTKEFSFSRPNLVYTENNLVELEIAETSSKLMEQRKPVLPHLIYTFELPFDAINLKIEFSHSPMEYISLKEETRLIPGPIPKLLKQNIRDYPLLEGLIGLLSKIASKINTKADTTSLDNPEYVDPFDETIYNSREPYGEPFNYEISVGRNPINNQLTTFIETTITPCTFLSVSTGKLKYFTKATINVSYTPPTLTLSEEKDEYDLLILTADNYINDLQPLLAHKEKMGLKTKLVPLKDVYNRKYFDCSNARDNAERIKLFIYNAIIDWKITYVMLVGGYRTFFGFNRPKMLFPIRFSHLADVLEDGYATDQYYSCCIRKDGDDNVFDSWDSNRNGIFAEWNDIGFDIYDIKPDVFLGRLACRNKIEVCTVVDKIINYEANSSIRKSEWFNRMLTVTGDGFAVDFKFPFFSWDTKVVPSGKYIISAQSRKRDEKDVVGPIDSITVNVDHLAECSKIEFYEDDHLKIEKLNPNQETTYPGKPVAEIVIPQDGDILGKSDVNYIPPEAYHGYKWAPVSYNEGIIKIRVKSYDPSPQETGDRGSHTQVRCWINNTYDEVVGGNINKWRFAECWYEGEVECLYAIDKINKNMPSFNFTKLHTSNGKFSCMGDVLDEFSKGYGLVYFAGHSCCLYWGDHLPGIPGGRDDGQINGIAGVNIAAGLNRYAREEGDPFFPIDTLTNGEKLPVFMLSGCHSGQFDTSLMRILADPYKSLFGINRGVYGAWAPEGMAWWLVRASNGGSIATLGFTGYGYGIAGRFAPHAVSGFLSTRFLQSYAEGIENLGAVHVAALNKYSREFKIHKDNVIRKHFESFVLLGDPSLKIGGYSTEMMRLDNNEESDKENATIGQIHLTDSKTVTTTIFNCGASCYTRGAKWVIELEGVSPLGEFISSSPIIQSILKGRVLKGRLTSDVTYICPGESQEINTSSNPSFGIGHIMVTVKVHSGIDGKIIAEKSEDGFLLGNYLLLSHSEE